MPSVILANLEKLLAAGRDSALLRYSLGNEYLKNGDARSACAHLKRALEQDPGYSAAWKLYAKALADIGRIEESLQTYQRGIEVAEAKGDQQAAREMRVHARRLARMHGDGA